MTIIPRPSTTPAADHTPAYAAPDLTTCDTEPIHVPGAIQPHGVLVAVDGDDRVVVASANLEELLGVPAATAIGCDLVDVVGPGLGDLVRGVLRRELPHEPLTVVLTDAVGGSLAGEPVDVRVHRSEDRVVLEVEGLVRSEGPAPTGNSLARLAQGTTTERLADLLAREVRALTAFDRVMVYRFDEQWNGVVVAEARAATLNPFLGLHYPATDIPAQARRLYRVNPIRLIADVHYTPVPLHPVFDPDSGQPLDLSHAGLRSVSPIHVEYLSNMGVTASMSVSILLDGELWGLVACHHYSGPHRPSQEARAAAEVVTQATAHLIGHRQRAEAREAALETQRRVTEMGQRIARDPRSPVETLADDPALLELVGATGVAICFDGEVRTRGVVPPRHVLSRIAAATDDPDRYVSSTQHLGALDADLAAHAGQAAGVLRIGSVPERWLMWFRPEQRVVVDWGGDPSNKRLAADADPAVRLSPRQSFEKWQEVTEGVSAPWRTWELDGADVLGRNVNAQLLVRSREQIAMAESVQRTVVLDRAPVFSGVAVAARYHPATSYQLGGDWWDVFELGDRVAVVVGDVAGHGVAAASAMTQLRTAMRAYLFEGHQPGECLDRLDALLDGLLDLGLATAVVATLDRTTGEVRLASAGHPAPLLLPAAGGAHLVDVDPRPMLGVGSGVAEEVRLRLDPGDGLLLYSDGLVERRGTDLVERTERLRRLAGDRPQADHLERWVDGLVLDLAATDAADPTDDDATLLVVRRS
ncbi:SpoIIE family protein phosphatase [Nocardioides litoris]|uniref:SpoIIE family protein phosphatase n=1 Tax=Nocardioides litoris TaxID=1926648 RepID=UPI00111EEED8|nr:SpoIIE family protein phosphatase [Nocardioides litoris]